MLCVMASASHETSCTSAVVKIFASRKFCLLQRSCVAHEFVSCTLQAHVEAHSAGFLRSRQSLRCASHGRLHSDHVAVHGTRHMSAVTSCASLVMTRAGELCGGSTLRQICSVCCASVGCHPYGAKSRGRFLQNSFIQQPWTSVIRTPCVAPMNARYCSGDVHCTFSLATPAEATRSITRSTPSLRWHVSWPLRSDVLRSWCAALDPAGMRRLP